jgi:transposase
MKALVLTHPDLTRTNLLSLANTIPGAWLGLKLAAFLLLLSGWKATQVTALLGVSRMGLWQWMTTANRVGLAAWQPARHLGCPPRLSTAQQQQLELTLLQSPAQVGLPRPRWDGPLVAEYVRHAFGVKLKVRQAQRWLRRLGFVLLQPAYRYVQAKKSGTVRFTKQIKKKLRQALAAAGQRVVLFADEAGFTLHAKLGRAWAKRGSRPIVWTRSQHRARLNLFGWVNPLSGERGFMTAAHGNTAAFVQFLEQILGAYPTPLIQLWVDNASWHKGAVVTPWLKTHGRLKLFYPPPYHPELNCQEPVWKRIRYEVTTGLYATQLAAVERSIRDTVASWSNEKVKRFCVAKCKLH